MIRSIPTIQCKGYVHWARRINPHDFLRLSTVQNNWGLGNLGRQDTNKTLASVFYLLAYLL